MDYYFNSAYSTQQLSKCFNWIVNTKCIDDHSSVFFVFVFAVFWALYYMNNFKACYLCKSLSDVILCRVLRLCASTTVSSNFQGRFVLEKIISQQYPYKF